MATATKKLTLTVSDAIADRLNEMADRRGITVSELIRRAVATQSVIDKAIDRYGDLVIVTAADNQIVQQLDSIA